MASSSITFAIITFILLEILSTCLGKQHDIGAWNPGPGQAEAYQKWSEAETFKVNDTIKFTFSKLVHNVVGLKTKEAFDNCDISDPTRIFTEDNAEVPLATNGTKYYVCGFGDHCQNGMKVAINVVEDVDVAPGSGATTGKQHNVGVWTTGPGQAEAYQKWSDAETFIIGDTLKFNYSKLVHNVLGLKTKEAFDNCDISDPARVFTEDNAVVPLATNGTKYYVCGFGNHCQNGMKVAINVLSVAPGTVHDIGVWTTGPGQEQAYQKWSEAEAFKVGDSIKFTYSKLVHNVVGLKTKDDFDNCDLSDPARIFTEDNAVVPLLTNGTKYYVCGFGDHCQNGMKVSVIVETATTRTATQDGTSTYGTNNAALLSASSILLPCIVIISYFF